MRRSLTFLSLIAIPRIAGAGACCLGGGPKTFIALRELQTYQIGLSSSFKDVYGHYDAYGDLYKTDRNQTLTLSLGAGMRLTEELDVFTTIPWVYQYAERVGKPGDATSLGDVTLGGRYFLVRNLFQDDWYPTVTLLGGLKVPSGTTDRIGSAGKLVPGTGNGIWEPFLGVSVQKDLRFVIVGVNATYTRRFGRTVPDASGTPVSVKEGDRIELSESATFPVTRRLSFAAGTAQTWDLSTRINGNHADDTAARVATVFASGSYFVTRYWSVGVGAEAAIPVAKLSMNQLATRSVTVTSTYSFY